MGTSIVRAVAVLGSELVVTAIVAVIDPQWLSDNAWWFGALGIALVVIAFFSEQFTIVRRSHLRQASLWGPSVPSAAECMPLYRAFRWLVQDSVWAANYPPEDDQHWVTRGDRALSSALSMGRIRAWGFYKAHREIADQGISEIPPDFWRKAQWNSHHMVTGEPPTHIWRNTEHGGGAYRRVVLDSAAVKAVWPRRSLWAAWRGRSPVERLSRGHKDGGYAAIWRRQDDHYRKLERCEPYGAFDAHFESDTPSIIEVQEPDNDRPIT